MKHSDESLILQTAAKLVIPLLLVFAVFALFRGHTATGGGFIGGLIAVSGFALYALAFSSASARDAMRIAPRSLIAVGWGCVLLAALIPVVLGHPLLTGLRAHLPWFGDQEVTLTIPLLFDLGVFFVVVGAGTAILLAVEARGRSLSTQADGGEADLHDAL
jgi:multicomponent Na+:H+ antiporter subunit B